MVAVPEHSLNITRPKASAVAQNERRQVDSSTNQVLTKIVRYGGLHFPKDDPNDTSPGHRIDRELRKAQIEMRLAELEEAYTAMATICAGQVESLAEKKAPLAPVPKASKVSTGPRGKSHPSDRSHHGRPFLRRRNHRRSRTSPKPLSMGQSSHHVQRMGNGHFTA